MAVSSIIGRNGNTVRDISHSTGVKITVVKDEDFTTSSSSGEYTNNCSAFTLHYGSCTTSSKSITGWSLFNKLIKRYFSVVCNNSDF